MRKAAAVLCTVVLTIVFASNSFIARAASDGEIVTAYCQGDDLYTYISLPSESEAADLTVQARIGSERYDVKEPKLQKISEDSTPVSYLFMIDISTSMPGFKDNIDKFVESILETAQGNVSFMAATFGEKLESIGDFSNDRQEFSETVKGIQYNANQTSLYAGIIDVINFYNQKERADGEIYNIIIISDGIEVDKNGPTQSEVIEQINKSTPVMIHTFGLCTTKKDSAAIKNSEEALKVLGAFSRATLGKHTTFGRDKSTEAQLAGEITDYMNNLYLAQFNLLMHTPVNDTFDLGLLFSSTGDTGEMFRLDKSNVPYLKANVNGGDPSGSGDKISAGDAEDIDDGTQNSEDGNTQESADNSIPSYNNAGDRKTTAPELFGFNVYLLISVLLAILLLFAFIIFLLKRKKAVPAENSNHKIFMKLEVIKGRCSTQKKELYLVDEFIIGRNKRCDITFKDREVSNKNSRVFIRDNMIYIEDFNSTNGTAVSGMKIHAPNRLRSGDEISIGTVKFRLKF